MPDDALPPESNAPLQFDRVEPRGETAAAQGASVVCSQCHTAMRDAYFTLGTDPLCERCKLMLESQAVNARSGGKLAKALLFGLGAAIVGAALYYAVIAITNLEIGLIAIACGYLVGLAVRKATDGWGGRRYQVLAIVLTYFSVGLAYTPLAFKGMREGASTSAAADSLSGGDSTKQAAPVAGDSAASTDTTAQASGAGMSVLAALGALTLLVFALPVMSIVGSMPSGLISALIIGFGMQQAWKMTAAVPLAIRGPFAVGQGPEARTP